MQYPPEGHHLPPDPLSSLGSLHPHTPHDRTAARTPPTPGAPTPRKPKDLEPSRAVPWLPSRTSGGSVKRARPGAGGGRPRSPWQRSAARHGPARPRSPPARPARACSPLTRACAAADGAEGGRGKEGGRPREARNKYKKYKRTYKVLSYIKRFPFQRVYMLVSEVTRGLGPPLVVRDCPECGAVPGLPVLTVKDQPKG